MGPVESWLWLREIQRKERSQDGKSRRFETKEQRKNYGRVICLYSSPINKSCQQMNEEPTAAV